VRRRSGFGLAISVGAIVGCASIDAERVPLCPALESLQPLPDAESCPGHELDEFSSVLSDRVVEHAGRALVRVELDDAAKVRSICVEHGPGYGPSSARRRLAPNLDAIMTLPPGPDCAARKRFDLNRYNAKFAEIRDREARCGEQVRTTVETRRNMTLGSRVFEREFENCMKDKADWIALDAPGSTRPRIFVKPEIPDPPGPPARDTASRCARTTRRFEEEAECIRADGFEMLEPLD